MYREHNPLAETVIESAVTLAFECKTCGGQKLLLVARFDGVGGHLVTLARTHTQPELANCRLREAARRAEVAHTHRQTLRLVLVHITDKVVGNPTIEGKHTLAIVVAANILLGHLLFTNLDTVLLCHNLQRLGIGDALVLHNECYGIARLTTSEALEKTL